MFARLWSILAWIITVIGLVVFVAWLLGATFSNRWYWSQWLLWIPTPLVVGVLLVALLGGIRSCYPIRIQWTRMAPLLVALLVVAASFSTLEHRFYADNNNEPKGLSVLCWSMPSPTWRTEGEEEFLDEVSPDIAILTWGDNLEQSKTLFSLHLPKHRLFRADGLVTVISLFPVREIRPVVSRDGIYVSFVQIDASPKFAKPLVVYVVDLPSNPTTGRMQVASELKRLLGQLELPAPDMVVGDFNMTRGSYAVRTLFPDLTNAYDLAGHGYAATFPRRWPLYHIDLALLAPSISVNGYELLDPGVGRHWAQLLHIEPAHRE